MGLFVSPQEKYLEAIGGPFVKENYFKVSQVFFDFIKNEFSGYKIDFCFDKSNLQEIEFMKSISARLISDDTIMKIEQENYNGNRCDKTIIPLSEQYYNAFKKLYEKFEDSYWTAERVIKNLHIFHVFLAFEKNQVVGCIEITKRGDMAEIYLLEVAEQYKNQGYEEALISKATEDAFSNRKKTVLVFVESCDESMICAYRKNGFTQRGMSLTYCADIL